MTGALNQKDAVGGSGMSRVLLCLVLTGCTASFESHPSRADKQTGDTGVIVGQTMRCTVRRFRDSTSGAVMYLADGPYACALTTPK